MASSVTAIPARYAKFLTALAGEAIAYIQLYGATWHLQPALVMLGAALAVLGVPNADKPPVTSGMTVNVTSTDPARVGQQVADAIRRSASISGIRPPDPPSVSTTPPPPARLTP